MQLVGRTLVGETRNHGIKVAMLATEAMEFAQQRVPIVKHMHNPR